MMIELWCLFKENADGVKTIKPLVISRNHDIHAASKTGEYDSQGAWVSVELFISLVIFRLKNILFEFLGVCAPADESNCDWFLN